MHAPSTSPAPYSPDIISEKRDPPQGHCSSGVRMVDNIIAPLPPPELTLNTRSTRGYHNWTFPRVALLSYQVFTGNRPSLSLLFPKLDAFSCGQLLAVYEHRTAVQGFVWGLNSFDQWGVELGKKLATQVKKATFYLQYTTLACTNVFFFYFSFFSFFFRVFFRLCLEAKPISEVGVVIMRARGFSFRVLSALFHLRLCCPFTFICFMLSWVDLRICFFFSRPVRICQYSSWHFHHFSSSCLFS